LTRIRIAIAQLDPVMGDPGGNLAAIRRLRGRASAEGAGLVVLPELALAGCPPRDPFLLRAMLPAARTALAALQADEGPALLLGLPMDGPAPAGVANAMVLLHEGRLLGWRGEMALADGSDPHLHAAPLPGPLGLPVADGPPLLLGLLPGRDLARTDLAEALAESGAEILLAPVSAPFARGGFDRRLQEAVRRVAETGLPLVQVNAVGGQDGRVLDGLSFALDAERRLVAQAPAFVESLIVTDWQRPEDGPLMPAAIAARVPPPEPDDALDRALVLALAQHVDRHRLTGAVVDLDGLPGGALVAALAVEALGRDRVHGLAGTAAGRALADRLGISCGDLRLEAATAALRPTLAPLLDEAPAALVERSLRALAAQTLAARSGALLLSAADKTALALGEDDGGEFALLGDLHRSEARAVALRRGLALPPDPPGQANAGRILEALVDRRPPPADDPGLLASLQDRLARARRKRRLPPLVVRFGGTRLDDDHTPSSGELHHQDNLL
jgi:NAD+ synthase